MTAGNPGRPRTRRRAAISIVELVFVVVIFGVLAAIAIPRLGRADEPSESQELRRGLSVLRIAIARFEQDHGFYPAARPAGPHAAGTAESFIAHLGSPPAAGAAAYLRDGVPPCRVARGKPNTVYVLRPGETAGELVGRTSAGWIYDSATGEVVANSDQCDPRGRPYASY